MLVFKGKLTAEDGAVFLKAMDAVMQKSWEEDRKSPESEQNTTTRQQSATENVPAGTFLEDQPRACFAQKRADALLTLSEQALATLSDGLRPLTGGDKYQVVVHLDANFSTDHNKAVCQIENGQFLTPLAPTTARRLACDASLISVMEDGGVMCSMSGARPVPSRLLFAGHCACVTGAAVFQVAVRRALSMHTIYSTGATGVRPAWIICCCFAGTIIGCCMRGYSPLRIFLWLKVIKEKRRLGV